MKLVSFILFKVAHKILNIKESTECHYSDLLIRTIMLKSLVYVATALVATAPSSRKIQSINHCQYSIFNVECWFIYKIIWIVTTISIHPHSIAILAHTHMPKTAQRTYTRIIYSSYWCSNREQFSSGFEQRVKRMCQSDQTSCMLLSINRKYFSLLFLFFYSGLL